ncbi:LCP family protein [Micromonospora sp. CPCC 206060]|uniref:LCP family protein n=1 Tax=Micromonospora sp. CPCC 206060 TaxID=3122406 RepID=UPI002FEE94AC
MELTVAEGGKRAARPSRWAGVPRWARVCTYLGVVLMVLSGGALIGYQALLARYEGAVGKGDLFGDGAAGASAPRRSDVKGPLNILLVGIDPRNSTTPPLADSIMIMNIPAGLDRAYLFSIPRDTLVDVPAFPKAGYSGGQTKINSAMARGSNVPGQPNKPNVAQGFELLSKTLAGYTGIERFDAGAIINFTGFKKIVDAMGGVDLYVDERTRSEHLQPDGTPRRLKPGGGGYTGPQKVYEVGQHHLAGWEALDFVRQRYGLKDGDYARQRHQQQFLKAMADQALSLDVVTNPTKLDAVLRAAGKSLVFDGRGNSIADFGFALRNLRSQSISMIKLPGGGVTSSGGKYQGEALQPVAEEFFAAVRGNTVETFLAAHPELLSKKL